MNTHKRAFTEAEASTYVGMSRSYLRQARMTGALQNRTPPPQHIKIGKKSIRYLKDDLDGWLEHWRARCSTNDNPIP